MKCKECKCCREVPLTRWSSTDRSYITEYVYKCFGVKEPFVIEDVNVECTEYPNKPINIENAIEHFKYGISHDIFSEPVTSYAKMAVEALEKQTPKKPFEDLHSTPHYRCPNCNNAVAVYEYDYKFPNCKWCGQALLWE